VARALRRLPYPNGRNNPMSLITELADFVGPGVITREVEYKGKTRSFHFHELKADEAEALFLGMDTDPKKNKGLRNRILAATLCNEDGTPAITKDEAGKLPNDLANKLQTVALEVNGLAAKASEEAKNE
jgi:hypothetical protein